jgi:hypothetical protein
MKMNKGDLVMFRKPNLNLYKYADRDTEELYIYGMVNKIFPPYTSFNKSRILRYNILSSDGIIYHEIREDKLIMLSEGQI